MGSNADAVLAFGYFWEEEQENDFLEKGVYSDDGEGLTEGYYGYLCSQSLPYLCILKTETNTEGCESVDVVLDSETLAAYTLRLNTFLEKYDIEPPQEKPGWFLASSFG